MVNTYVLRARSILIVYIVFSVSVVAFDHWSDSQKELREWLVPMTGWNGSSVYMWTLGFASFALVKTDRKHLRLIVLMLAVATLLQLRSTMNHAIQAWSGSPDFGNPYLMYHPIRPLITVVPATMWTITFWLVSRKFSKADEPIAIDD